MPPIVLAALGVAGGVTLATWIVREARRVNGILHPEEGKAREPGPASAPEEGSGPRLRRDASGVYRQE